MLRQRRWAGGPEGRVIHAVGPCCQVSVLLRAVYAHVRQALRHAHHRIAPSL